MVFLVLVSVACGAKTASGDLSEKVTNFDGYPLVWLGASYDVDEDGRADDLRVARSSVTPPFYNPRTGELLVPEIRTFSLGYGDCERPKGASACPIPLTMVFSAPCETYPLSNIAKSGSVNVRGVDTIVQAGGALRMETADFTVTISPVADSVTGTTEKALRIAEDLVPANAKARDALTGSDFRSRPANLCETQNGEGTSTPAPEEPSAAISVGVPSLVAGKVEIPISTGGSGFAAYSGFSIHLRWSSAVFSYSSVNITGGVLASPVCANAIADGDGGGVTVACVATGAATSTTGLLATIVLTPSVSGCSTLHLFTFGPPDNGVASNSTYTVDADTNAPQAAQYVDGTASVAGEACSQG